VRPPLASPRQEAVQASLRGEVALAFEALELELELERELVWRRKEGGLVLKRERQPVWRRKKPELVLKRGLGMGQGPVWRRRTLALLLEAEPQPLEEEQNTAVLVEELQIYCGQPRRHHLRPLAAEPRTLQKNGQDRSVCCLGREQHFAPLEQGEEHQTSSLSLYLILLSNSAEPQQRWQFLPSFLS
jgi:hypothetical protein